MTVADADRLPEVAASCGQICVAILAQRASDKSPAIRSKALAGLAGIVSACMERKEDALLVQLRQVIHLLPWALTAVCNREMSLESGQPCVGTGHIP